MDEATYQENEKEELVKSFKTCAPLIQRMLNDDISVAVVEKDTHKTLYYLPGETIDHGIREGDICPEKSIVVETAQTGETIARKAGPETFGFSYFSQGTPIYDSEGSIIAGIAVSKSLEKYEKLAEAANEIKGVIDKVGESAQNLAANSQELLAIAQELSGASENLNHKTKETGEVLKIIEKIANQTKLLGLNASIEAARLGEQGKGFNVVAEEIQKLAQNSVSSLQQIDQSLGELPEAGEMINQNVANIREMGSKHAEEATEVNNMVQKLNKMAQTLSQLADEL